MIFKTKSGSEHSEVKPARLIDGFPPPFPIFFDVFAHFNQQLIHTDQLSGFLRYFNVATSTASTEVRTITTKISLFRQAVARRL